MIPLAIFTGVGTTAILIKAKNLSIRINELLEIEQAYYRLLEEGQSQATGTETKSNNFY
jgi:hypothetical protein